MLVAVVMVGGTVGGGWRQQQWLASTRIHKIARALGYGAHDYIYETMSSM